MEYIISENELIDYTSRVIEDGSKSLIGTLYKAFLKSKQPVELMAEGEVMANPDYSPVMVGQTVIADTGMTMGLFNKFQELDNQHIKIYIQKLNDRK